MLFSVGSFGRIWNGRRTAQARVLFERHFRDEEAIFGAAGYPLAQLHKRCHGELVERATKLFEKYLADELTVSELFGFIATDIVARHLLIEDKKLFSYL